MDNLDNFTSTSKLIINQLPPSTLDIKLPLRRPLLDIIGCGYNIDLQSTRGDASKWGALSWIFSGNFELFVGNEQTTAYRMLEFTQERGDTYIRIDGEIPEANLSLDDTSDENLQALVSIGDQFFEKYKEQLSAFFE